MFNSAKWAGPWQGMLGSAAQPSTWKFLKWLHNIQTKKFCNTVKRYGPCLGEHDPAKVSNVFEVFHTIPTKSWLNDVTWAGPCLGEHDQPFIWTLLKICITLKRKNFSTSRNELGRDRGCWGARPSHQLESSWNGCIISRRKGSSTPWTELGRVWGSTTQPKFECFWKASRHPDEKLFQHHDKSWTVFGGARPAVHLNVVESLHNIKMIPIFNVVKKAGPRQGMLGSAAQPSTWMFLNGCITSSRKSSVTPWIELGRV